MEFFKTERPRTELQQKKQQVVEQKFLGSMKHHKGMTLFSINTKTGEIKPAEFVKKSVISWDQATSDNKTGDTSRKLVIEKDCVYLEALNEKNAWKHYYRILESL